MSMQVVNVSRFYFKKKLYGRFDLITHFSRPNYIYITNKKREKRGSENQATQVAAIIMAGASIISYIVGEGFADAANKKENN